MREGFCGRVMRQAVPGALLALVVMFTVAAGDAVAAAPTCQPLGVVIAPLGGSMMVTLNCSDADGGHLVISTSDPPHGSISESPAKNTVVYTPDPGHSGMDDFTYKANDGTTDSADAGGGAQRHGPWSSAIPAMGTSSRSRASGGSTAPPVPTSCSRFSPDPTSSKPEPAPIRSAAATATIRSRADRGTTSSTEGPTTTPSTEATGADQFFGGGVGQGTDTVTYRGSSPAVVVDLGSGTDNRGGTLTDIEKVVGTGGDDQVLGAGGNRPSTAGAATTRSSAAPGPTTSAAAAAATRCSTPIGSRPSR